MALKGKGRSLAAKGRGGDFSSGAAREGGLNCPLPAKLTIKITILVQTKAQRRGLEKAKAGCQAERVHYRGFSVAAPLSSLPLPP
jgi:hypothetical protein